jgi:hypothetical protein
MDGDTFWDWAARQLQAYQALTEEIDGIFENDNPYFTTWMYSLSTERPAHPDDMHEQEP